MKYYGVKMEGKFFCQKYGTLTDAGSASPSEEGRMIYVEDEECIYLNVITEWRRASRQSFITLTDCPSSYSANELVIVNSAGTGMIFTPVTGSVLSAGIIIPLENKINSVSAGFLAGDAALSASTIVRAVTSAGVNRKIPVWDGDSRELITAHTSAYITSAGEIYGEKVYNAIWNDIADFIEVDCPIEYGFVYIMNDEYRVEKSTEYCQRAILGICTDTYGFGLGNKNGKENMMPICIGGFVLAYVDQLYPPGTILTSGKDGILTKLNDIDIYNYPERGIAMFMKPEPNKIWNNIIVNGRHWVKVK